MATFSVNQVRHLYVVKNTLTEDVTEYSPEGAVALKETTDHQLFFKYKGADSVLRSDLITPDTIDHAVRTHASKLGYTNKIYKAGNAGASSSITPANLGVFKIIFRSFPSPTDADFYSKYFDVSKCSTWTEAAYVIQSAFREDEPKIAIYLGDTKVDKIVKASSSSYTAYDESGNTVANGVLKLGYAESSWRRGIKSSQPVEFDIYVLNKYTVDQVEYEYWLGPEGYNIPSDAAYNIDQVNFSLDSESKMPDGKLIADMEYFYVGERGDIYRGTNWPYNIETTYLVDPTKEYDTLDIHFSFSDTGESVQKSEKDIIIVAEEAYMDSIVAALTAKNVTIKDRA